MRERKQNAMREAELDRLLECAIKWRMTRSNVRTDAGI